MTEEVIRWVRIWRLLIGVAFSADELWWSSGKVDQQLEYTWHPVDWSVTHELNGKLVKFQYVSVGKVRRSGYTIWEFIFGGLAVMVVWV